MSHTRTSCDACGRVFDGTGAWVRTAAPEALELCWTCYEAAKDAAELLSTLGEPKKPDGVTRAAFVYGSTKYGKSDAGL